MRDLIRRLEKLERKFKKIGSKTKPLLREFNGIKEVNGHYQTEVYVFKLRLPVSRKDHMCNACLETIERGHRYVAFVTRNVEGPGFEQWRVHGECYLDNIQMFGGKRPSWRWFEIEEGETA